MSTNHKNKVLIIFAHPALQKSRINKELCRAVKSIEGVTFRDLYELYPDFLIDVQTEQKLLLDHDVIVLQHPFYWYSCPAIIKEWIDLVLEYGFAYGHNGTALAGKSMMTAITAGGSEESYTAEGVHYYHVRDFLRTFERTAALCNMNYLPPFVVHHTSDLITYEEISVYSDVYSQLVVFLTDNDIEINSMNEFKYINDYILNLNKSGVIK